VSVLAAVLLASTSLHITVWPNGVDSTPKHSYTLRCAPVGGTLPARSSACARLAKLTKPFAPTPKGIACTQIYSGPAEATVTGRFRGQVVNAHFNRKDGCETARFNRVRFLFPGWFSPPSGN
jgi:hypothetical protein